MTNAWSSRVLRPSEPQHSATTPPPDCSRAWPGNWPCATATPLRPRLWVDLGSGTGRLADALEQLHPGQSVLRLDGSRSMLNNQRHGVATLLHDLNSPLPTWSSAPALLCSSFVLHAE